MGAQAQKQRQSRRRGALVEELPDAFEVEMGRTAGEGKGRVSQRLERRSAETIMLAFGIQHQDGLYSHLLVVAQLGEHTRERVLGREDLDNRDGGDA